MASAAGGHGKEDWKSFAHEVGRAWKGSIGKMDHEGYTPDYSEDDNNFYYGYRVKCKLKCTKEGVKNLVDNLIHYHAFIDSKTKIPMIQLTCAEDIPSRKGAHHDRREFVETAMKPDDWVEHFRQGLKSCWESLKKPGVTTASSQRTPSPTSRRASSPSRRSPSPSRRSPSPTGSAVTHSTTEKAIPCKFFAQGKCKRGNKCPYMHITAPRSGGSYRRKKSKRTQKLRYRKNKRLTIKRTVNRTYHKS